MKTTAEICQAFTAVFVLVTVSVVAFVFRPKAALRLGKLAVWALAWGVKSLGLT